MNVRAICEGQFTLPVAGSAAAALFTPEGERRWADSSWNPIYALPEAVNDDSAPGTVFMTDSDGDTAIWIVLDRREDGIRYALTAPEQFAGTIGVIWTAAASRDESRITVSYDMTSLGPAGIAFVEELRTDYAAFLESWREGILDGLASFAASDAT